MWREPSHVPDHARPVPFPTLCLRPARDAAGASLLARCVARHGFSRLRAASTGTLCPLPLGMTASAPARCTRFTRALLWFDARRLRGSALQMRRCAVRTRESSWCPVSLHARFSKRASRRAVADAAMLLPRLSYADAQLRRRQQSRCGTATPSHFTCLRQRCGSPAARRVARSVRQLPFDRGSASQRTPRGSAMHARCSHHGLFAAASRQRTEHRCATAPRGMRLGSGRLTRRCAPAALAGAVPTVPTGPTGMGRPGGRTMTALLVNALKHMGGTDYMVRVATCKAGRPALTARCRKKRTSCANTWRSMRTAH